MSATPKGGHVFDLDIGESVAVGIEGRERQLKLLEVIEPRCTVRGVIRFPRIKVEVDGNPIDVHAALYHMPVEVDRLRVGCSVTKGVSEAVSRHRNVYSLDKDARIRCWAVGDPLFDELPLVYPVKQTWFSSMTQMANERVYVDGGELPTLKPDQYVYHHYGMDFGGFDKAVPVVAARAGTVVCVGEDAVKDYDEDAGGSPRYDRVVVRDETGWHFLYSHIEMISPEIELGGRIESGKFVGTLGKEGSSGGWSHLHFGIRSPQPSGRYGEVEGYPFLVEAWLAELPGALIACARPHLAAAVGETIELDGSRSLCDGAGIASYRWTLQDGREIEGERVETTYDREGMYSEILTVKDDKGRSDVDFCVVQILPKDGDPSKTPPSIHLTHYPTQNIRAGQPVAFKVRAFFKGPFAENNAGEETWDFGDGTRAVTWSSLPARGAASTDTDYGERWHSYKSPGRYIVKVSRTGANGLTATAQVKVEVAA